MSPTRREKRRLGPVPPPLLVKLEPQSPTNNEKGQHFNQKRKNPPPSSDVSSAPSSHSSKKSPLKKTKKSNMLSIQQSGSKSKPQGERDLKDPCVEPIHNLVQVLLTVFPNIPVAAEDSLAHIIEIATDTITQLVDDIELRDNEIDRLVRTLNEQISYRNANVPASDDLASSQGRVTLESQAAAPDARPSSQIASQSLLQLQQGSPFLPHRAQIVNPSPSTSSTTTAPLPAINTIQPTMVATSTSTVTITDEVYYVVNGDGTVPPAVEQMLNSLRHRNTPPAPNTSDSAVPHPYTPAQPTSSQHSTGNQHSHHHPHSHTHPPRHPHPLPAARLPLLDGSHIQASFPSVSQRPPILSHSVPLGHIPFSGESGQQIYPHGQPLLSDFHHSPASSVTGSSTGSSLEHLSFPFANPSMERSSYDPSDPVIRIV